MADELNPYESPAEVSRPTVASDLTFGEIVKRGFTAAHGAPAGAVWAFLLLAPMQILGAVINGVMFGGDFFEKLQSGEFESGSQPPPELFMMMGGGCFMCIWLPVIFFAMPWIWGGTVGQVRERVLGQDPAPFGSHGKRYYVPMLLLMLLFGGIVIVVSIPNVIVGQVVASQEVRPGQVVAAEQMRALSRHPLNIASSIITGLVMAAIGTGINLTASAIVARGRGIGDGLGQGFAFCSAKFGDVFKLYLLYLLLMLPFAVVSWLPQVLAPSIAIWVIIASIGCIYLAYLTIVNFGLAGSLFAARGDAGEEPAPVSRVER